MVRLPFSYIRTGQITVRGKINGRSLDLLVDTGASHTVVHIPTAEDLGLVLKDTERKGGGVGGLDIAMHQLPNLELVLGGQTFLAKQAHAMDLSHVLSALEQYKARKVECILGADVLRKYRVVIDYGTKELIFPLDQ